MDINKLVCFLKVAEYNNISRASEELYLSQQGVSRIIKSIEKKLDCQLFERTNKGLRITEQGRLLYKHAQTICGEYYTFLSDLDRIK